MALVDVDRLKRSGQRFVTGFTPGQKVISVLGVAALVLATIMFMSWSSTPTYEPLFSNLGAKDAASVTSALNGMGVSYKLANGGATVLVPADKLYQARLDVSAKGLPSSSDSYALLDKQGITTSEFQQNVLYQRAVQGQLAKTIEAINGVQAAIVNLSLPSNDPFADPASPKATAAVQVDTGSNRLGGEQVQSIVHLVSSSVKDLSPDAVTVTDTNGNLLYAPGSSSTFASTENLSRKMAYEAAVKARIDGMLTKMFGPGRATVAVDATIDFSTGQSESTNQTPVVDAKGNPIPSAQKTSKQSYVSPPTTPTGLLGPNGTPAPATGRNSTFTQTDETRSNIVNSTKSVTQLPGFKVDNLSVAVGLDAALVQPTQIQTIQNLVAGAAGIQTARKDKLVVSAVPMDAAAVKLAQDQFKQSTTPKPTAAPLDLMAIVRYAFTFLIVAIVLFLAWRSIKKAQLALGPVRMPLDLAALEAGSPAGGYANELPAPAVGAELPVAVGVGAGPLEAGRPPAETEVVSLIERQPDDVAQTLRSWLADRRT